MLKKTLQGRPDLEAGLSFLPQYSLGMLASNLPQQDHPWNVQYALSHLIPTMPITFLVF